MRLRRVNCPKCAASVELLEGEPAAICKGCGTIVTEALLVGQQKRSAHYPNTTPIRLGRKCHYRGKEYEVVGRVVFAMHEEGETYTWDEWQLLAPDGDILYLEHDEGQWKLTAPFVPQTPISPAEVKIQGVGTWITLDGHRAQVRQMGLATVKYVEGEFTHAIRVNDTYRYLDAVSGNRFYSVEWKEDEIEFFRGELIAYRQLLVMFSLYSELATYDASEKRSGALKQFAVVCLGAGLLAFFAWTSSFGPGRMVGNGSAGLSQIPREAGIRYGPFQLDPARGVHRLRITGNLSEASAWVGATVEAPDESEVLGVQRDMWDESGHDSDGYWHESDLDSQTDFLPAKAGPYFVRLYAEPEGPRAASGQAYFRLSDGILYPWYLLWYSLIAFAVGSVALLRSSPAMRRSLAEAFSSDDDD